MRDFVHNLLSQNIPGPITCWNMCQVWGVSLLKHSNLVHETSRIYCALTHKYRVTHTPRLLRAPGRYYIMRNTSLHLTLLEGLVLYEKLPYSNTPPQFLNTHKCTHTSTTHIISYQSTYNTPFENYTYFRFNLHSLTTKLQLHSQVVLTSWHKLFQDVHNKFIRFIWISA